MVLRNKKLTGFALLMSLIVVSVVISIGLVVLDLTLKQLRLSTNSKDSETAFHAANAAMECARFWRNAKTDDFVAGNDLSNVECFGESVDKVQANAKSVKDLGKAFKYSFKIDEKDGISWGTSPTERCSQMDILVLNSEIDATTTITDMTVVIPGYPEPEAECAPGGRCTIIAARGYSSSCDDVALPGTVEREVLLEL